MIPSWFWHFGILKMSYPNGRKVWSIVYRWPRYFGFNHNHHVIDESKWFWRFGILKMSYPNGQKVWSIVYRWPRYFGLSGQNPRETSKMLQTCAERLESCTTMWYMIPSDPRKFEPETELIMTFWYFEDVISKWSKILKYSIPLTKILRPRC